MSGDNLLQIDDLQKIYPITSGFLRRKTGEARVLDGVSLSIKRGETLGVVGESGCGKSTLAKMIMGAQPISAGSMIFRPRGSDGVQLEGLNTAERRQTWRQMQMIYQDPFTSLNPRMTVQQALAEPLRNFGIARGGAGLQKIVEILEAVGLDKTALNRYPHAFSGGQRQRIGIARALVVEPELIIGDEPVSALDASVGAQIINLFFDLKTKMNLTYLLISHDLGVIRHSCDRIAVMYLGQLVEIGSTEAVYSSPQHPYTQALIASVPSIRGGSKRQPLPGEIATPRARPNGCPFHPRCAFATDKCKIDRPLPKPASGDRLLACHHPLKSTQKT